MYVGEAGECVGKPNVLLGDPGVYVGDFCENVGEYNDLGVLLSDLLFPSGFLFSKS